MSVRETMKWRGYTKARMKTCPACREKKLFPKGDDALNALSKKDNKTEICIDCGYLEDAAGLRRNYDHA